MLKRMLLPVLALGLVACQSGRGPLYSGPIIDPQGVDMGRYQADLTECEAIADQVPVGERAVAGAAVGAAVGGVVGGIMGNRRTAVRSAGVGAVGGGVQGAASGMRERDQVVHNCLRGRGYRVLN
jgi:outer membrane lipoprotein SlyB